MAKEEYDFTKRQVIDLEIYWFIIFMVNARELFGSRLRYNVYKIVEHCFSLFKPSLLKLLKKLIHKAAMIGFGNEIYQREIAEIRRRKNLYKLIRKGINLR